MMEQSTEIEQAAKPRFNLVEFARETQREIAKVTWPSRKETLTTTIMIAVMALIVGVFFLTIDSVLGFAVSHILGMNS